MKLYRARAYRNKSEPIGTGTIEKTTEGAVASLHKLMYGFKGDLFIVVESSSGGQIEEILGGDVGQWRVEQYIL
jgi:hypothetical protein